MSDPGDPPEMDDEYLKFLHDEGLDMLAAFRAIREKEKRDLILELAKAIAESQSNSSDAG